MQDFVEIHRNVKQMQQMSTISIVR